MDNASIKQVAFIRSLRLNEKEKLSFMHRYLSDENLPLPCICKAFIFSLRHRKIIIVVLWYCFEEIETNALHITCKNFKIAAMVYNLWLALPPVFVRLLSEMKSLIILWGTWGQISCSSVPWTFFQKLPHFLEVQCCGIVCLLGSGKHKLSTP